MMIVRFISVCFFMSGLFFGSLLLIVGGCFCLMFNIEQSVEAQTKSLLKCSSINEDFQG